MNAQRAVRFGILFAVGSAMTFGVSGPLAKALMAAGWTPNAAVTARLVGGALVMVLFATLLHRDWLHEAVRHRKTVVLYGVIPIAGAQLCYYNAVSHLSVGVALLLEYQAPVLVVGWLWVTTRRRPGIRTLAGAALALAGTVVVLDVFSGARIDTVGVAWALGAAVCAACYFLLSDRVTADGSGLNSVTLAAGGLIVGAAAVAALGLAGVLPLTFTTHDTVIAGHPMSFVVPVVALGVVSTAIAYTLGIGGVARLRPGYASLLGLGEVLCAVVAAWALVDEEIRWPQTVGGSVVLLGLALAGTDNARRSDVVAEASWPDAGRAAVPEQRPPAVATAPR